MELRQLEMLLAVVGKGGYVQAGRHMHVAHSAVHRQVHILEDEVGEPLLVRAGRGVRLTPAGDLLVDLARRLRAEIHKTDLQLADLMEVRSGELRVGTSTTTLVFFLAPVLARFRKQFPGVDVRLLTGTADQLIQEMNDGHLDLAIVNEACTGSLHEEHLEHRHLYEEEIVFATAHRHPLAHRRTVSWEEVANSPLALFPSTSRIRSLIDSAFQRHGLVPRVAMELETEEAIAKVIEANMAAGFVTRRRSSREHLAHYRVGGERVLLGVAIVFPAGYVPRKVHEFIRMCESHASSA